MSYDLKAFRTVKHGSDGDTAYCRHCKESRDEGDVRGWARNHAMKTLHTVDFYRHNWTEYTCHVKDLPKSN